LAIQQHHQQRWLPRAAVVAEAAATAVCRFRRRSFCRRTRHTAACGGLGGVRRLATRNKLRSFPGPHNYALLYLKLNWNVTSTVQQYSSAIFWQFNTWSRNANSNVYCNTIHAKSTNIRSHSATCYPTQVIAPRPNPSPQAGTRFTYPGGMEGWVDLGYPAMQRPGVDLATSRSQVRRPNHYTTEPTRSDLDQHWVERWRRLTEMIVFSRIYASRCVGPTLSAHESFSRCPEHLRRRKWRHRSYDA